MEESERKWLTMCPNLAPSYASPRDVSLVSVHDLSSRPGCPMPLIRELWRRLGYKIRIKKQCNADLWESDDESAFDCLQSRSLEKSIATVTVVQDGKYKMRGQVSGAICVVNARFGRALVHLQAHSIMDLVIGQGDVVFIYVIPVQTSDMSGSKHDGYLTWAGVISAHHFFNMILDGSVPVWAAMSFLRSPTVSSGLHFTRT